MILIVLTTLERYTSESQDWSDLVQISCPTLFNLNFTLEWEPHLSDNKGTLHEWQDRLVELISSHWFDMFHLVKHIRSLLKQNLWKSSECVLILM